MDINKSWKHERISLNCKKCNRLVENLSSDVAAVTCSYCIARMVAPPVEKKKPLAEESRPRGWHLKRKYVSPSGKIYSFGKEVSK